MTVHATEPGTFGPSPALVARAERPRGTVLLLHGLGADGLAMIKELSMLQGAGWNAIGLDAPQHGRRFDPGRDQQWAEEREQTLTRLVTEQAAELNAVLDDLERQGFAGPYAAVGISLGAYALWHALPSTPRLGTAISVLGSPALPEATPPAPGDFVGRRLLAIHAEWDEVVPAEPGATLIADLAAQGEDVHRTVLPESLHGVEEPQWWWTWGEVLRWLEGAC